MYENTRKALEIALKEAYDKRNPLVAFGHLGLPHQLVVAQPSKIILNQGDPARYFYLLLVGQAIVMNRISFSTNDIIDYIEPPHIFGLMEYVENEASYTAYVVAKTKCILLRIKACDFMNCIRTDAELCYRTLIITAHVTAHNMNQAETHRIFPAKDILGHYLYLQSRSLETYICPLTRKELSEKLSINLRTLYRYLDTMETNGYLSLQRGKIVIKQEHLQKLAERYGDVVM